MYNLCLFDLDGTLIDSQEGITKSLYHTFRFFGIPVADIGELKKFIGPPLRDSFRTYSNLSEADIEKAIIMYREHYSEKGIYENSLYEGTMEMLSRLNAEGIQMVIATSKLTAYAEQIAERFDMKQYFDLIVGSEIDGTHTRKSEAINYALNKIDPDRRKSAVMIGDSKYDVIGSQEVGIDNISVTWGYGSRSELKEANAMKLVDSPNELCTVILGTRTESLS